MSSRAPRRIGFLIDDRLYGSGAALRTDDPMLLFALGFRDWFDEVVLIARVFPETEPGRAPYALPTEGVRVVPLPPYPRVQNLYLEPWRYWRAIDRTLRGCLPDLDAVWLNFGHPISQRALALSRRLPDLHPFAAMRGDYERDVTERAAGPALARRIAGVAMGLQMRAFARSARRLRTPCLVYGDEASAELRALGLDPIEVADSLLRESDVREPPSPRDELACDLIAVGRLSREKGFDVLLRALVDLEAAPGRPATLRLVGSGEEDAALRDLAHHLGVAERVRFDGHVPFGPELFTRYASARLAVVPSRTEGVPKAALEAMAFGTPVLATAVGGLPRIVGAGGERGRVAPAEDPDALRSAAAGLLADPNALKEMGERARAFASELTLERQVRHIVERALPHLLESGE